jgi:hypothetical protein
VAKSPSHKFGQIIGNMIELSIEPLLFQFAQQHGLYLDKRGKRPARRGTKVSWTDSNGNKHDLDYVLEKGGSDTRIGIPVAFIEVAWRRYTKHSRNKAQEIQGALKPLAETYRNNNPFLGAVIAGVFTNGALTQLESLGFKTLYFPYDLIIQAFGTVNINALYYETTPDSDLADRVSKWNSLPTEQHRQVLEQLMKAHMGEILRFMQSLTLSVSREVILIRINPIHGATFNFSSIEEALNFIESYDESNSDSVQFLRYGVEVHYNNGENVKGEFLSKQTVMQFMRQYHQSVDKP